MCPRQSTLKASAVHAYARHLLAQALELESFRPAVPLGVVASVLVLAACWQTSLTGACRLVKGGPSHHQVRDALYGCLPPRPRDLLSRLLAAFRLTWPDHLGRAPRVMALDLHQIPYYGKRTTKGCTRRQKKASTRKSFTYATLAVLDRCGRFTVGLLPVRPHMRLRTVVERLLGQAQDAGLSPLYLMLDKEFYAAEVVDLLQRRCVPFLMPCRRGGKRPGRGNYDYFQPGMPVGWYDYQWSARLRRTDFGSGRLVKRGRLAVRLRLCVARHQASGEPLVYAAWGLGKWPPAEVVRQYRRRFGVEAGYRQLGQCRARTSSGCERLRLLLVGLALLLCNLWGLLHDALFSAGPTSERHRRPGLMRLGEVISAVAASVANLLGGYLDEWHTQRPLPPCFTADLPL